MMIPTADDIKTVTDMRENTLSLLDRVQKKEGPTIIMYNNTPRAVMLSVEEYNNLMEAIEDYSDELEAISLEKQAKKASKKDLISLKTLVGKHHSGI